MHMPMPTPIRMHMHMPTPMHMRMHSMRMRMNTRDHVNACTHLCVGGVSASRSPPIRPPTLQAELEQHELVIVADTTPIARPMLQHGWPGQG